MGVISYLLTLVLIHGLLISQFSYMGNASQAASVLSYDFYYKLKVVSHKEASNPPPAPALASPIHVKPPYPGRPPSPPPPTRLKNEKSLLPPPPRRLISPPPPYYQG